MLSRPTTEQILDAVATDLRDIVAPAVSDEAATVTLEMIDQVLGNCSRRAAHEIGWMHEEMAAIDTALDDTNDPATRDALDAYRQAPTDDLHLDSVQERYHLASAALSCAVDAAFESGEEAAVDRVKALIRQRLVAEGEILGQLDLVGRG